MLKAYTSNVVTSQRIYRSVSIKKKAKRAVPLFYTIVDIISILIFISLLFILIRNSYNELSNITFFRVKNVELNGLKLLDKSLGLELLQFINGINIFEIKEDFIKERLSSNSTIQDVQVKRKYPNSILIDVTEKKPFIQMKQGEQYHLFDKNLVPLVTLDQAYTGLLTLEVQTEKDIFHDKLIGKETRNDLMSFLTILAEKEFFRDNFILNTTDPKDLLLISKNSNMVIKMGFENLSHKLERLKKFILSNGIENFQNKVIDNRFKGMIIVNKL
jgi:cell division protein FtsQ